MYLLLPDLSSAWESVLGEGVPIGANGCLLETGLNCLLFVTRLAGGLLLDLAAVVLFWKVERGFRNACKKTNSLLVRTISDYVTIYK